jgi:hypothetical protein
MKPSVLLDRLGGGGGAGVWWQWHFAGAAERSWRKRRFLFFKCKNSKWFSLLVDADRFSRLWGQVLRFAPRKMGGGNDVAEEERGVISLAGVGDGRIRSCLLRV